MKCVSSTQTFFARVEIPIDLTDQRYRNVRRSLAFYQEVQEVKDRFEGAVVILRQFGVLKLLFHILHDIFDVFVDLPRFGFDGGGVAKPLEKPQRGRSDLRAD